MSIHLTIISDSSGVVVLVTSSGKVENKVIHFNETISKMMCKLRSEFLKNDF